MIFGLVRRCTCTWHDRTAFGYTQSQGFFTRFLHAWEMAKLHFRLNTAIPCLYKPIGVPSSLNTKIFTITTLTLDCFVELVSWACQSKGFHVRVWDCKASHLLDRLIRVRVCEAICTHVGFALGQKPLIQHFCNWGWFHKSLVHGCSMRTLPPRCSCLRACWATKSACFSATFLLWSLSARLSLCWFRRYQPPQCLHSGQQTRSSGISSFSISSTWRCTFGQVRSQPCLMSNDKPLRPSACAILAKRGGEKISATAHLLSAFCQAWCWDIKFRFCLRDKTCFFSSGGTFSFISTSDSVFRTSMTYWPAEFTWRGFGGPPPRDKVSAEKSSTAFRLFIVFLLSNNGADPLITAASIRPFWPLIEIGMDTTRSETSSWPFPKRKRLHSFRSVGSGMHLVWYILMKWFKVSWPISVRLQPESTMPKRGEETSITSENMLGPSSTIAAPETGWLLSDFGGRVDRFGQSLLQCPTWWHLKHLVRLLRVRMSCWNCFLTVPTWEKRRAFCKREISLRFSRHVAARISAVSSSSKTSVDWFSWAETPWSARKASRSSKTTASWTSVEATSSSPVSTSSWARKAVTGFGFVCFAVALKSGKQLLIAATTVSILKSPWVLAVTMARWSSERPLAFRQIHPRASEGKSTSTFLRHLAKASWTLDVQATIVSPSFWDRVKTSFRHSASQSCLSLSGNLSSSAFQRCLSPFSSLSWSRVRCSTVSSAVPSKRQKTKGPLCWGCMSFWDAIRASTHRRHRRYSKGSSASPVNLLLLPKSLSLLAMGYCFLPTLYLEQAIYLDAPFLGLRYQLWKLVTEENLPRFTPQGFAPFRPRTSVPASLGGCSTTWKVVWPGQMRKSDDSGWGYCFHIYIHYI